MAERTSFFQSGVIPDSPNPPVFFDKTAKPEPGERIRGAIPVYSDSRDLGTAEAMAEVYAMAKDAARDTAESKGLHLVEDSLVEVIGYRTEFALVDTEDGPRNRPLYELPEGTQPDGVMLYFEARVV